MKKAIIQLVKEHDGEWSWYQLDRALSLRKISTHGRLMTVLKELETLGLITSNDLPEDPQPRYSLTEAGRRHLNQANGTGDLEAESTGTDEV